MKYYVSYQNRYKGVYSLIAMGDEMKVPSHWEEISKEQCDYLASVEKQKMKDYVPKDYNPVAVYRNLQELRDDLGV